MIYLSTGDSVFAIFKLDCIVVLLFLLKSMNIILKIHLKSGLKFIKKGTKEMNDQEIKKIIIDSLIEQNAFNDLPPPVAAQMAIDMVLAILKKASEK